MLKKTNPYDPISKTREWAEFEVNANGANRAAAYDYCKRLKLMDNLEKEIVEEGGTMPEAARNVFKYLLRIE